MPTLKAQPVDPAAAVAAELEFLREKGMAISIPGPADTVDQDAGGLRSALAKMGIGYIGWTNPTEVVNVYPGAAKTIGGAQVYNGQQPSFAVFNYLTIVYDLRRFGLPDGQFIVGTEQQYYQWAPGGPSRWGINTAAIYWTMLDRAVEVKTGYLRNGNEFAGLQVGGNQALSLFGASSNMLYQAGLSTNSTPTPGVNVKFNLPLNFYNKVGVAQSISPDGVSTSIIQNPTGLDWTTPNAGVFYLDEFGFRQSAAPGRLQTWVRAGVGYNTSKFNSKVVPGTRVEGNEVYYLLGDRQLWQMEPGPGGRSGRGVYGGFSVIYAPPEQNTISQYQEGRIYGVGLFDSRPEDVISLVATNTVFSSYLVNAALTSGKLAHSSTSSVTASYAAHLAKGIYASIGLGYINNPTSVTYTKDTGHALNVSLSASVFF